MGKYLESCQTDFWKEVFEKELGYLLRELKGTKDILSVGCGPAFIEKGLQENGFNVTGLDVTKEALEGAPDSIRTMVGSAENMDFEDSSFDAVIFIASLQFINNYEKAIQETARVLKPEGKLLVMLLNPKSEFFRDKRENEPNFYINKIKHTDLTEIKGIISQYFSIEKAEYFLGIKNKEIFDSNDTELAALYIITGVKK